jgi:N6-L-threonylcarbamoyladenine synthase
MKIQNPQFIDQHVADLCASLQGAIVDILLDKLVKASQQTGIKEVVIGGGVSANSGLRSAITLTGQKRGWNTYLPKLKYTTDNAAMIGMTAYFKYKEGLFTDQSVSPLARYKTR